MNYKHPHEWLFSIFIVKERPWSAVPRGKGCVLYAGAFHWQAPIRKKLKNLSEPRNTWVSEALKDHSRLLFKQQVPVFLAAPKQVEASMQRIAEVELAKRALHKADDLVLEDKHVK